MNKLKEINGDFMRMHINYYTYEWTWAYEKMIEFFKLDPDTITASDIIRIVERWKDAVIGLDKMVYEDAKKEFSLSSMTGFGADGTKFENHVHTDLHHSKDARVLTRYEELLVKRANRVMEGYLK